MSYDKLIDSAQLDGALSASANAIRAKNGDSAKISWNATTGFANAIAAIASGIKVATGTFTTNYGHLKEKPITVSGLGFKPTRVIFYYETNREWLENAGIDVGDSNGTYIARYYEDIYDPDEEDYYSVWYTGYTARDKFKIDLLADGFKIYATGYGLEAEIQWHEAATYQYIAIG